MKRYLQIIQNVIHTKIVFTTSLLMLIICFSNTIQAQEAIANTLEVRSESQITSATTDEEIGEMIKLFDEKFKLGLEFKKIYRNENNEITGFKIVVSNEKGFKKNYNLNEGDPIDPFVIYVETDGTKVTNFDFRDGISDQPADDEIQQPVKKPAVAAYQEATIADSDDLTGEKAFQTARLMVVDDIDAVKENKSIDYKMAYISLNGKEITVAEMEKIDPNTVSRVSTMNKASGAELAEKYGEKARYGVIIIETMINTRELTSEDIAALPEDFALDPEEGAFIIHKKTQESDLEFYKKQLAKINVTLEYTGLERNNKGDLSAIQLKLKDEVTNVAFSNWMKFASADGIINVFVGKKKGRINISTR